MNNLRERERNKLERLDGEVDVVSFKEIGVDQRIKFLTEELTDATYQKKLLIGKKIKLPKYIYF